MSFNFNLRCRGSWSELLDSSFNSIFLPLLFDSFINFVSWTISTIWSIVTLSSGFSSSTFLFLFSLIPFFLLSFCASFCFFLRLSSFCFLLSSFLWSSRAKSTISPLPDFLFIMKLFKLFTMYSASSWLLTSINPIPDHLGFPSFPTFSLSNKILYWWISFWVFTSFNSSLDKVSFQSFTKQVINSANDFSVILLSSSLNHKRVLETKTFGFFLMFSCFFLKSLILVSISFSGTPSWTKSLVVTSPYLTRSMFLLSTFSFFSALCVSLSFLDSALNKTNLLPLKSNWDSKSAIFAFDSLNLSSPQYWLDTLWKYI